jgi:hypothetical protein
MTGKIGPVQLMTVGSPREPNCGGENMNELSGFERHKTIRILDLLFVSNDAETGDSELLRTLRPTANVGGKREPKELQR